jgi:hypothetical protein
MSKAASPPTYNTEHIASAASAAASAVASDPRFGFLHRIRNERFAQLRPLSEFFDKNRFSLTASFQTISQRWRFVINHLIIFYQFDYLFFD